ILRTTPWFRCPGQSGWHPLGHRWRRERPRREANSSAMGQGYSGRVPGPDRGILLQAVGRTPQGQVGPVARWSHLGRIPRCPTGGDRMQHTTLITDFDNTLYDWFHVWYQSFSAMFSEIQRISGIDEAALISEI